MEEFMRRARLSHAAIRGCSRRSRSAWHFNRRCRSSAGRRGIGNRKKREEALKKARGARQQLTDHADVFTILPYLS
jgi:hypothetical protein